MTSRETEKSPFDELRAALAARQRRDFPFHDLDPLHLPEGGLRRAAVLVPLLERDGELCLLFTKRPMELRRHAGQVDHDRLVVAVAVTRAVVAGVGHRAVVAAQVVEERHVDRLLVGEHDRRRVEVDLQLTAAEEAPLLDRVPPQAHADQGQLLAVLLLQ